MISTFLVLLLMVGFTVSNSPEEEGGEITDKQPWGIAKITDILSGVLNFFFMFFQTLISPGSDPRRGRHTQDFGPGGGGVPHVTSKEDFDERVRQAGGKLVVVDFYASWCGPCLTMAPKLRKLAAGTPDVVFLKVDVDECLAISDSYDVESLPTFVFLKDGTKLDQFTGSDIEKVKDFVTKNR